MADLSKKELAGMIDYSALRADTTAEKVRDVCRDAILYGFHSVCINPCYIGPAKKSLEGSTVKVAAVLAYPLGATLPEVKAFEAKEYVNTGADELDMVMNIGAFKSGDLDLVKNDIESVVSAAKDASSDTLIKVIIETGLLSEEEIVNASSLVKESGADFVKSGTGWDKGATVHDVKLMRGAVGEPFGVKAAGGITTLSQCAELVDAGANRIGTSSGPAIMGEFE